MKPHKIRIKYLRRYRTGKEEEFYSTREVGQVIEETAFNGIIDTVIEIEVIDNV